MRGDERSEDEMEKLIAKLRVYTISDQDDAGRFLRREFPKLFYIVSPECELARILPRDLDWYLR